MSEAVNPIAKQPVLYDMPGTAAVVVREDVFRGAEDLDGATHVAAMAKAYGQPSDRSARVRSVRRQRESRAIVWQVLAFLRGNLTRP